MRLNLALIPSISLASAVLASPHPYRPPASLVHANHTVERAVSEVEYYYWAGALLQNTGTTFSSITGSFYVPHVKGTANSGAATWIGVEDTCTSSIRFVGVAFFVDGNQETTYKAWYSDTVDVHYIDMSIAAGDHIRLSLFQRSLESNATAVVENFKTHDVRVRSINWSDPSCEQNAMWLTSPWDTDNNGDQLPLANFGTVLFFNNLANSTNGQSYTPEASVAVDMVENGHVVAFTTVAGPFVGIHYVSN